MTITARIGLVLVLLLAITLGCASDELTGPLPANQPPTAWLSIAPPEGSTVDYTVRIFWGGWDPDGDVAYFEYAITNNETGVFDPADTVGTDKWHATTVRDSVFLFSADVPADSSILDSDVMGAFEFLRSHTFFIRAVDKQGARSKPVYRSFTARNLSPLITVLIPNVRGLNLALVPPVVRFIWVANDPGDDGDTAQRPDSVRSILLRVAGDWDDVANYIRTKPRAPEWTPWVAYDAPGDSGLFWQPEQPLAFGSYVFAVQAKDEAGAVTPVFDPDRNLKRIRVQERNTGPVLTLENEFLGTYVTSSANPPVQILDLPAGIELRFSFAADASSYGGTVVGYRYGWDMIDLGDDEQWETDFTPFVGSWAAVAPRRFFFGTHTLHIEIEDNSGQKSRAAVTINVVPFTMERDLLLIDDWDEGSSLGFHLSRGVAPTDSEHDAFWRDMLGDVETYLPDVDVAPQYGGTLRSMPITLIAKYRHIIWNARGSPTVNTNAVLNSMIREDEPVNLLVLFMRAGGRVLVCGENPMTMVINKTLFPRTRVGAQAGPPFPFIFKTELPTGAGVNSFAYRECCLNVVDVAWGKAIGKHRSLCDVFDYRSYNAPTEGLRAAVPVDGAHGFPRLELRPEVSGADRWYRESNLGLNTDVYNPPYFAFCPQAELDPVRSCFEPIYSLECLDVDSGIYGAPVAFWTSQFDDVENPSGIAGRSAVWGFSPVYFNPSQVKEALGVILFDEWGLPRR